MAEPSDDAVSALGFCSRVLRWPSLRQRRAPLQMLDVPLAQRKRAMEAAAAEPPPPAKKARREPRSRKRALSVSLRDSADAKVKLKATVLKVRAGRTQ